MSTAITGLWGQAASINNVSNNLANTSTVGYKSSGTTFENLVNASDYDGVKATTDYHNDAQGTITSSDVATYMALSGKGYFTVTGSSTDANGVTTIGQGVYYTRNGDFTLDANGYLVNSDGYYLLGWEVDPKTDLVDENALVPVQVSTLTDDPISTTLVKYAANLPASATLGTTTSANSVNIFDASGTAHKLTYQWTKSATDLNEWTLNVTVKDGALAGTADYTTSMTFNFDDHGAIVGITSTDPTVTVDNVNYTVAFNYSFAARDATGAVTGGADPESATTNFSEVTQYDDKVLTVVEFDQNGATKGSFDKLNIDQSGLFYIEYDNGAKRIYYEIPVATFNSADNLEQVAGGTYMETAASGTVTYSEAGTGGAGKIKSSSLESSTVDIATEFTTMIGAEKIYSANAKTITTVDQMMQGLRDL
jgi:flagellar hook protein FlgE